MDWQNTMKTIILGQEIPVIEEDFGKDPDHVGEFSPANRLIKIHSRLNKKQKKKTLFHEEVHALLDISGITAALAHATNQLFAEYLDEQLAHAIEEFVFTNYDIKRKSGL